MTKYEKIKQMTKEELTEYFQDKPWCKCHTEHCSQYKSCDECIMDYLDEEVIIHLCVNIEQPKES